MDASIRAAHRYTMASQSVQLTDTPQMPQSAQITDTPRTPQSAQITDTPRTPQSAQITDTPRTSQSAQLTDTPWRLNPRSSPIHHGVSIRAPH
ncbi:hypothetical protein NDU88_007743 [Pleurodeles waltl]|uniref:Uncharacterized protein n=1 Tax=Pleurodeles waltl TaxID=8319 RepID=A0AAV7U214_PLEWA|nr:hypothetical protein NDU88_007743 [Pleurodeles waltl]